MCSSTLQPDPSSFVHKIVFAIRHHEYQLFFVIMALRKCVMAQKTLAGFVKPATKHLVKYWMSFLKQIDIGIVIYNKN